MNNSRNILICFIMTTLFVLYGCTAYTDNTETESQEGCMNEKENIQNVFLKFLEEVSVTESSVIFPDSITGEPLEIMKNPERTVVLFPSLTALWYEAGGSAIGCIGGNAAESVYTEQIGRNIAEDAGMQTVALSSAGKQWDVEKIIALKPNLIICSDSMNGYAVISEAAKNAGIPVICADYDDFADYLKWYYIFCLLNGKPQLWEETALPVLNQVTEILTTIPNGESPRVFSLFTGSGTMQANTSRTVIGEMLQLMNAENIADVNKNSMAERIECNLEAVYAEDPDIILIQCHADTDISRRKVENLYGKNPVWLSLRAVQSGRVYYLDKSLFHNKPNRRYAEAYRVLAELLYPEWKYTEK